MKKKVHFVCALPIANCAVVVVLFVLSIFNKAHFIMYIAIVVSIVCLWLIYKAYDKDFLKDQILFCPSTYSFVFAIFTLFISLLNRMAQNGDELGVWALESKAFFLLDGFDAQDRLVAIGYSKYYPAQMLFESWICRMGGKSFTEGLMYIAYYYLYLSFCLPIFNSVKTKKIVGSVTVGFLFSILLIVVPSCVESAGYYFLSAELIISAGFALLLHLVLSNAYEENIKYYLVFSVSSIMMFTKETGAIFVLLAFLLSLAILKTEKKIVVSAKMAISMLIGYIPVFCWNYYCERHYRYNYFPGIKTSLETAATDYMTVFGTYLNVVFRTMFKEPINRGGSLGLSFTILLLTVLIIILFAVYVKGKILSKNEAIKFCTIYIVLIVLCGIGLAYTHAYIIREDPYKETSMMIWTLSRYLEPLFTGVFIYVLTIPIARKKYSKIISIALISIVILTARYELPYEMIINTDKLDESVRQSKSEAMLRFGNLLESVDYLNPLSILLITTGDFEERRVRYEVCPNVIDFMDLSMYNYSDSELKQRILDKASNARFSHIYFEGISNDDLQTMFGEDVVADTLLNRNILFD